MISKEIALIRILLEVKEFKSIYQHIYLIEMINYTKIMA